MIVPQELSDYRRISEKYKFDKVQECINLARTDMREHIGDRLFFDVMGNLENPVYEPLLEGGDFIIDEITYNHEGLKSMFADFTYARYLYVLNVNHGPFGLVSKESQDSSNVDMTTIKTLAHQAKTDADRKWELVRMYLNQNKETFPVWNNNRNTNSDDVTLGQNRFTFISSGTKPKM